MHKRIFWPALLFALVLVLPSEGEAESLRIIGFNVEAGWRSDADLSTITAQVSRLGPADIWGFSEVSTRRWPDRLKEAAGSSYGSVLGSTSSDRLLVVFNTARLEVITSYELKHLQLGSGGRAPLVVHFKLRDAESEFLFMVNHLHRVNNVKRHLQAAGLHLWASDESLPVVAVGDYNYDWNVPPDDPDQDYGYDLMTNDEVFVWVRPAVLVATQCHDRYNSVLDFAFVANDAKDWASESNILEQNWDCNDTSSTSDHRPVAVTIEITN